MKLPLHEYILTLAQVVVLACLITRLLVSGLARLYKYFFCYLLVQLLEALVPFTLPYRDLYGWAFLTFQCIKLCFYVLIIFELYSVLLGELKGIARLAKNCGMWGSGKLENVSRTSRPALSQRVKDADAGPVVFVLVNELLVSFRHLVGVVSGLARKDNVQADVEVANIHRPIQGLRERPAGKEDRAGVIGQILPAGVEQSLLGRIGLVFEGEEDVVRQEHRSGPSLLGKPGLPQHLTGGVHWRNIVDAFVPAMPRNP